MKTVAVLTRYAIKIRKTSYYIIKFFCFLFTMPFLFLNRIEKKTFAPLVTSKKIKEQWQQGIGMKRQSEKGKQSPYFH